METCFNYTQKERGYFSSDERKYITKVRKLKEKYPEQVRIIREPENNDGCIYCELPTEWFTIRVPKKMDLTDEQVQKYTKRFSIPELISPEEVQNDIWIEIMDFE